MAIFIGEQMLFLVSGAAAFSEVFPADVLEDGEAEGVEQEVPSLVLFLYEAAGCKAESVADRASQQQNIQLRQSPSMANAPQWRL